MWGAYAGKSQLAYTMMHKESTFVRKVKNFFKRTKRIEIHVLKNDKDMQVVLWDLAGQEIFCALHEHLFPKITTICLYLFVFNPFKYCGGVCSSPKAMEEAFKEELKAWLQCLCTNSNISKEYLPHVVIVVTHHDKLLKSKNTVVKEIQDIIEKVSKQFEGSIEISKDHEHVFCVDGRDAKDIQHILCYLYEHFKRVSTTHVDQVPDVCNEMNSFILKKQSKLSFMTVNDFNDLCKSANETMNQVCDDLVFVSMRKYLHDVGTVIDLAEEDLVITNPNWLSKDFLGQLISIGHGFETPQSKVPIQLENGYVSLSQLNILFSLAEKCSKLDPDTLRRILIGLELAHEVYMHGKCKEIFDKSLNFENKLNCIWLHVDGYKVLIECDYLKGQHVDVLVKISRAHKTANEDAWSFIGKILEEIRKFYAQPKGAPGVALVSEIIRRECVELPTPCHFCGKSQAISIRELKESLEKSLREVTSERLRISGPSLLYHHTWPKCKEAKLECGSVPALDLLRGCPDARELHGKVNHICGKLEEKTLESKEHEKTCCAIASLSKEICEKSTRSMPKLPYFTSKDVNLCSRLAAKLKFSIPMKMHFMCESSTREHNVPDQEGFEITVEEKNRKLVFSSTIFN